MNRFTATALVLATLLPTTLHAQQPEVYTLTVTAQDVNAIGQALGDQPYKTAAPLITKLNEQIAKQISDAAKAKQTGSEPKKSEPNQ
jgi:hypothetical protein